LDSDIHVHPRDLGSLFAKRPLLLGESASDYDDLLAKVTATMKPTDIIEAMEVKEIVDDMWEAQRHRRLKASFLRQAGLKALESFLESLEEGEYINGVRVLSVPNLVEYYAAGDQKSVAEVEEILALEGLDADSILAQVFAEKFDQVEGFERQITRANARRAKAFGEIERRRDALTRRRRLVAGDITDVR
jgi:hypothetical protein